MFNIFEGNKILVERINIIGNNVTNEDVVRGELKVDEGDPFTKVNFERSIADIRSRNIFKKVDYKISNGSKNDLRVIDISVEEKATGEISAGAGVGTDGGSFAFNIQENNWLGEGKSLSFDIEVDQESLTGTFSYHDPNYNYLETQYFIRFLVRKMTNQTKATKIQFSVLVLEQRLNNIKMLMQN